MLIPIADQIVYVANKTPSKICKEILEKINLKNKLK